MSRSKVVVAVENYMPSETPSFMLLKINTQAYEVIDGEPCPSLSLSYDLTDDWFTRSTNVMETVYCGC
jgi:hypothetical protein